MAGKEFWSPLTRSEYEAGRPHRLKPDDIENGQLLTSPRIGDKEDKLGFYAVEYLVEVTLVEPGDMYFVGLYLLDADGQRVAKKGAEVTADGLIRSPGKPNLEGYFSDATDKYGLGPLAVNEVLTLAR